MSVSSLCVDSFDETDGAERVEHLGVRLPGPLFGSAAVPFGDPEQPRVLTMGVRDADRVG